MSSLNLVEKIIFKYNNGNPAIKSSIRHFKTISPMGTTYWTYEHGYRIYNESGKISKFYSSLEKAVGDNL